MEKEFVTYELALRMKQLGFDEPCISAYNKLGIPHNIMYHNGITYKVLYKDNCLRPTWQSAFAWFDGNTEYSGFIVPSNEEGLFTWWIHNYTDAQLYIESEENYLTREEAQHACLEKLCEIVEKQKEDGRAN